ncbi:unnamed protein product [Effrenium voratum]|uniref:Uncharacterized protein n=1 Tax=Effrenium voratum TaxID=2562239 RepID=A0AA36JLA6_9DINO|nr:unnamed protein product [Effrenium voratum]CAJ1462351.1 unnamed protein product [Effrenium voratum]
MTLPPCCGMARRRSLHWVPCAVLLLSAAWKWDFLQAFQNVRHRAPGVSRAASEETPEAPEDTEDTTNVELFRQSLIQGWGAGDVASSDSSDWAEVLDPAAVRAGDVLLGDPRRFFGEGSSPTLRRIGLQERIPEDYPRRERLRYLPVILLTSVEDSGKAEGVWLTLRTGQLLGDFINFFHSRPLLYGGPSRSESVLMVHPYAEVEGAKPLPDGLFLGGSFESAQAWVEEGQGSSLRMRFFLNRIEWQQGELAAELAPSEKAWLPVRCSVDLVLSETDAIDAKPLWVKVAESAGGQPELLGRAYGLL